MKSGAQRAASANGVALIAPDTSPSKVIKPLELILGMPFISMYGLNIHI